MYGSAAVPNITATWNCRGVRSEVGLYDGTGAIVTNTSVLAGGSSASASSGFTGHWIQSFDASRVSSVYQNTTTVDANNTQILELREASKTILYEAVAVSPVPRPPVPASR